MQQPLAYRKQKSLTGNQPAGSFIGDNRDRMAAYPSAALYIIFLLTHQRESHLIGNIRSFDDAWRTIISGRFRSSCFCHPFLLDEFIQDFSNLIFRKLCRSLQIRYSYTLPMFLQEFINELLFRIKFRMRI